MFIALEEQAAAATLVSRLASKANRLDLAELYANIAKGSADHAMELVDKATLDHCHVNDAKSHIENAIALANDAAQDLDLAMEQKKTKPQRYKIVIKLANAIDSYGNDYRMAAVETAMAKGARKRVAYDAAMASKAKKALAAKNVAYLAAELGLHDVVAEFAEYAKLAAEDTASFMAKHGRSLPGAGSIYSCNREQEERESAESEEWQDAANAARDQAVAAAVVSHLASRAGQPDVEKSFAGIAKNWQTARHDLPKKPHC